MSYDPSIYGYVNGKAVFSRDEFVFECRHSGAIESDEELIAFAEKVTSGWSQYGHKQTFIGFYLSDYALEEPYRSLTNVEFKRLKELQAEARAAAKAADEARKWKFVERNFYADNSIEDTYEDKNGIRKTVLVEGAHGDVCY